MPPAEFQLAMILADMTWCWGRRSVTVTREELATRCNTSRRSVERVAARLAEMGALDVQSTGRGNRYTLVEDWDPMTLKLPKRVRESADNTPSESPNWRDQSRQSGPHTRVLLEDSLPEAVEETNNLADAPKGAPIKDPVAAVEAQMARGKRKRARARHDGKPSALWQTWQQAHVDAGIIPLAWAPNGRYNTADAKAASTLAKSWSQDDIENLHNFMDWAVAEWKIIMLSPEFSWMDTRPDYPRIRFLSKHRERFHDLWRAGVTLAWRDGPNAKEIERLFEIGSVDEARKLIGKAE